MTTEMTTHNVKYDYNLLTGGQERGILWSRKDGEENENNRLLEINFQNARCSYDTNKNMYVHKKKSTGKVDMVVSMLNAVYLLEQDVFLNQSEFTIQVL